MSKLEAIETLIKEEAAKAKTLCELEDKVNSKANQNNKCNYAGNEKVPIGDKRKCKTWGKCHKGLCFLLKTGANPSHDKSSLNKK